ncbi:MAG: DUF1800 domain-containing protein, partial [Pseudomonadales bacterium]|nr:DUF1800 domain-containing protein [Pseudomonadales bacterium]
QYKYSNPITGLGDHQLIVGPTPLQITLRDDQTGTALTDLPVTVYEVLSDGSTKWTIQRNSDAQGTVTFDLNGLGDNRNYRLKAKAFNNYSYYSPVYTEAKSETLRLGKVRVAVSDGSQDNHPPLTDTAVTISKQKPDGKFGWFANATTDQQGQLKLDFPDLDNGAVYRLSTKSLVADSTKYSDEITANGSYQFVVGNPAVTVHLFNALTGTSLSQQKVTAYELMADGSKVWRKAGDTDSNGRLTYDLDGLEDGRRYVLKAAPYNGGSVYSVEIPGYGDFDFPVGALPVTLVDKDTAAVLANRKITAYQILPEGKLNWYKQSETDTQGRIIFDLEGLAMGESFVFKSYNPFGENKSYYSGVIRAEGEYRFEIQKGETDKPDLVFPEVAITSPTAQSEVPARGFVLRGTASDNELLSSVEITINSAGKPAFTGTAEFEPQTGEWQYFVTEAQLTPENITDITVVALDGVNNASEAQARYTVAEVLADLTPPEITITSHQDNDSIKKTGVTLQGNATDDVGIQSLFATVVDPVQGRIVDNKALAFDLDNGHFELVLLNGQLTVDAQIEVTLSATDDSGKTTNLTQHYRVIAAPNEPLQMANRLTFGMTPDLLAHLEAVGPDIFLNEQLNPDRIDNAVFDMLIAGSNPQTEDELKWHTLQYMLFSERQLQEVLTQFWDNHFNTALSRHGEVAYEVAENNGFRQHALGQFRDLLEVSAKSPAMILYLNNAENVKSAPNENYARELMELHTLGVDGGYTSTDVAEVARSFTGWHVQADRFFFNAGEHDEQPKTVLGQSLTQGGLADGEEVLDILASHPATARFICTKLAQLLITDNPPESLVSSCQSDFLASGGNIASVVEGLIHSPLFASNEQFRNKVKTPLEMVTTLVRNFTANVDPIAMDRGMRAMGMNLFANQVPTGWSELGEDWINSNLMLQRARFVNQVAYNTNPQNGIYIDIRGHMQVAGMTSAEAIVAYLFDLAFAGDYSETEFAIGVNILNENGTEFDLNAPDAELRLRSLLGHVLSFPGYQFQ